MSIAFQSSKRGFFPFSGSLLLGSQPLFHFPGTLSPWRRSSYPYEDGRHLNEDGHHRDYDGRHGDKALKLPLNIWDTARPCLEIFDSPGVRFITLSAFPPLGNQIARFSKRTAHLAFPIVRKGSLNREKSQHKIDQDFGRNRKMAEKGVVVKFCLRKIPINHYFFKKLAFCPVSAMESIMTLVIWQFVNFETLQAGEFLSSLAVSWLYKKVS